MPTTNLPTLVVGDQRRRLVSVSVTMIDHRSGHEIVELVGTGPDGQCHLVGPLADVLAMIWQLDVRLNRLARGDG